MAETQLKAGGATGSQINTQNPQTAGQPANLGVQSSKVQPGTANDVLNRPTTEGVPLSGTQLPSVNLSQTAAQTTAQPQPQTTTQRDINPAMIAGPATLFVLAVVVFWAMSRSAKNTTY